MIRLVFIFALALFVTLFTMWKVEASPPVPELKQLIRPPQIIEYQQKPHAVFDYGGAGVFVCGFTNTYTFSPM